MIRTKLLSWVSIVVYSLTFFLTSFAVWIPPARADCVFIIFCSPRKSSFRSKGGVRRGPCAGEDASLTALAPERKLKSTVDSSAIEGYPTTVEEHPTFWFYLHLSDYQSSIKSAKFVLLDEAKHIVQGPIYASFSDAIEKVSASKSLDVIASLTIPATEKPLEMGKQYSWFFSITCDNQKPSRNPEATGQIQRVLQGSLPKLTERAYIVRDITYNAQNDSARSIVWYDTVNQLAQKRDIYPADWNTLLSESDIPTSVKFVKLQPSVKPPQKCDALNNSMV